MKRVAFYTLGCKVNQYDTEAMSELFEKEGYTVVDFDEEADVYVINTCAVTAMSTRKSRQIISKARSRCHDAIVVVAGCYSQTAPEEVLNIPGVNLVIGTNERSKIVEYVKQVESEKSLLKVVNDIMNVSEFEGLTVNTHKERTRAVLKIQEGCNQFCTYCIIPYARGPIRSRSPESVMDEVRTLAGKGFKEIVLTGIHLASYGKDLGYTNLLDIIRSIHEVQGIERIRLGSLEPGIITAEFVEIVKNLTKLCPHYHVSLQSGCDETLKRMNRKYTTDQYRKAVGLLRNNIEDVAVTTDVIVGFPGETDEEFDKTYRFVDEMSFARMHVFKYSPRKGTRAAAFKNQINPQVKEMRSEKLIKLSNVKMRQFNARFIGRDMKVLFEQKVKDMDGYIEGLTANYIRVVCEGDDKYKGTIAKVRLENAIDDYVIGSMTVN